MLKKEASSTLVLMELHDALPPEGRHDYEQPHPQRFHKPSSQSCKFYKPPTHLPSAQCYKPSAPSWTPSYNPTPDKPSAQSYKPSELLPTYGPEPLRYSPPYIRSAYALNDCQPPLPCSLVLQNPYGEEALFGEVGLHCYNLLNGTNLEFLDLDKFFRTGMFHKEIKLNAYDPIRNAYREFMTRVVRSEIEKVCMRFITKQCRLLPDEGDYPCDFVELAVDDFFKGDMPNSMPEDTCDNLQYYELKESEVKENMAWLRVYADLAYKTKLHYVPHSGVWTGPYKLTKVIVQTRKDVESENKVMAENAIFYISIKTSCGRNCYTIIRRTTDGLPGHMSLEVKCSM